MLQVRRLILFGWLIIILAGCTISFDLQPPWRAHYFHSHESTDTNSHDSLTQTVVITQIQVITRLITVPVAIPVPAITAPLHILTVQPLTASTSVSFTRAITNIQFARACTLSQAIGRLPGYSNAVVLAAVTRPITTVVDAGTTSAVAFAPATQRTVYWHDPQNTDSVICPMATPWLWHQSLLLYQEDTVPKVVGLALPAAQACTITTGSTVSTFQSLLTQRGEWSDLLYVERSATEPTLLMLQRTNSCGSGAGCATLRAVCQSLFVEGAWQNWCKSICN